MRLSPHFTLANGAPSGSVALALSNVNLSGDNGDGLDATAVAADVVVTLDNAEAYVNGGDGLFVGGQAAAHISRSTFNQNGVNGVEDGAMPAGVFTTGDNTAHANGTHNVLGATTSEAAF